jgi:glycosyltransferase involved in cell wall biosynthesis
MAEGNRTGPADPSPQPASSPSADSRAPEVSVVIPCLNESRSVGICVDKALQALQAAGIPGEVVVADNGSSDGSQKIAAEHGARVVHAELRGYGHALRAGIAAARGPFIVMGDADDSYDFLELPRFVAKWREGFEVVMGNRFRGGIKPGAMPWLHQHIGNPLLSGILNLFFHTHLGDAHCGMRGFTKDAFARMDLRTTGMEFASEFVIKAAKLGARRTEIPITLWPDKRGRSPHLRSFPDGWRHLRFMLLYAPNWLFIGPGALLAMLGLAIVVWLMPGPRRVGRVVFDLHTMVFGLIFALLGVQIVFIGLFARVFSYTEQFNRQKQSLEHALYRVKLEHGLLAGAVIALVGLAGNARIFFQWAGEGFGPLHHVRDVIFWSLWLFLGVQIFFSSIFLSMLGISRDTFIGAYGKR